MPVLVLLILSCVTLDKSLYLCEPQFPYLENGDNNSARLMGECEKSRADSGFDSVAIISSDTASLCSLSSLLSDTSLPWSGFRPGF